MKKKSSFVVMLLLVGAALISGVRQAEAVTCQQIYQACLSTCGGNLACRLDCVDQYNACRYF